MSLPKPDLHIRIIEEAKATLRLLAYIEQQPESVIAARYLEESLMGKEYVVKIAVRQLRCAGFDGSDGE